MVALFRTNPTNSALLVSQYRIFRVQNQVTSTTGSSGNNPTGSYTDAQSPNLYVFADPTAISASGSYGFQVKNSNGDVSFDSRMRPLQIHSTVNITHPLNASNALASGLSARNCSSNHSSNFLPNVTTLTIQQVHNQQNQCSFLVVYHKDTMNNQLQKLKQNVMELT